MFDAADDRAGAARARSPPPTRELATARRAAGHEHGAAHAARRAAGPRRARGRPRSPYPAPSNAFPERLASLAEMIDRGLPLRVVALDANGGYDTHENQAADAARTNLGLLSSSLAAFQADLEARGIADRVLVHVWSEFGRRPQANGSGTDHGAGGASLVMGTQATGTMVGEFPGLATLDAQSNLRHTVDFRARLQGPHRAVARRRRRRDRPRRGALHRARSWCDEAAAGRRRGRAARTSPRRAGAAAPRAGQAARGRRRRSAPRQGRARSAPRAAPRAAAAVRPRALRARRGRPLVGARRARALIGVPGALRRARAVRRPRPRPPRRGRRRRAGRRPAPRPRAGAPADLLQPARRPGPGASSSASSSPRRRVSAGDVRVEFNLVARRGPAQPLARARGRHGHAHTLRRGALGRGRRQDARADARALDAVLLAHRPRGGRACGRR